ncbi:MAG: hypothetical protein A3E31_01655 [Candidatus Rokubacteria bacterium RIFCSPHIGHO2_12_FULL_73_22]|nr:MAG: hypothetical protein A3E31_01655 [Candidatus Rokubacteria bacterium RIFCSPHIGHO2_12_FULL_73_22]
MLREHADVLAALAERRHVDRDHVEPVVEVLAEALLPHHLREVLVRGSHDAHVHAQRSRAAEPLELALLEHAQDLRLRHRGEVGDLVEEQRAAVGQLEAALLAPGRTGERALLVAEQLGLEQRLGQRRAVDGHEGPLRARRARVDRLRDQLLARAALALDQHRRRAVRDLLDERHHPPEGGARADRRALLQQHVEALLELAVLLDQLAALERLADEPQHLRALERLGEEVVRAVLHGPHGLLDGAERGQEDHVHVRGDRLGRAQHLDAGEAGHLEVGEHQVDPAAAQALQRRVAVGGQHHAVALARERALEALPQPGVVVGDQQRRGLRHSRSS